MTTMHATPIEDEWSIADLENLPPEVRAEVHNGKLVIMSPARLWHQHIERMICNLLAQAGRHAYTQVGVLNTARDTRVAQIGVFRSEPNDPQAAWHDPVDLELVVEVRSPSSAAKDRNPQWYAERGIPEYWLAEPIEGQKWAALTTRYELARTPSGTVAYIETGKITLDQLAGSR